MLQGTLILEVDALKHRNGSHFRLHCLEIGMLRSLSRTMSECYYLVMMCVDDHPEGMSPVGEPLCKRCFWWCNGSMVVVCTTTLVSALKIERRITVRDQTQVSKVRFLRAQRFVPAPYLLSLQMRGGQGIGFL